jgi:hypothetical protein
VYEGLVEGVRARLATLAPGSAARSGAFDAALARSIDGLSDAGKKILVVLQDYGVQRILPLANPESRERQELDEHLQRKAAYTAAGTIEMGRRRMGAWRRFGRAIWHGAPGARSSLAFTLIGVGIFITAGIYIAR